MISLILGSALQAMDRTDEDLAQAAKCLELMQVKDTVIQAEPMTQEDLNYHLAISSKNGKIKEIEAFLELGADINGITNIDGRFTSPLLAAISANKLAIVIYLIAQGAHIDIRLSDSPSEQDPLWLTPVHYAAMLGYEDIFSALISYGQTSLEATAINLVDHLGNTPLHYAAKLRGSIENTRLLLEKGANSNAQNCLGYTPIFDAAFNGHAGIIQLLLEAGASHYLFAVKGVIHSALAAACSNGQDKAVDLLLGKCKFILSDIEESLGRLDSFARHLCCAGKPKETKCAKCLESEEKISYISDKLHEKQKQLMQVQEQR